MDLYLDLLISFLEGNLIQYWLYVPFFGLFVASVPGFIRSLYSVR